MHSHNKMTGMKMPTMTLFDERWSKVMKKHVEMTMEREAKKTSEEAPVEESMTTGEMAEHMLTRVEEAVDEDTADADEVYPDEAGVPENEGTSFAFDSLDESHYPEDTYDKSWDRVMGIQKRSHDVSEDVSEGEPQRVEYLAKLNGKQSRDPHMQRKLTWLVALCFSYIAYCGFTRLIQQEASQAGETPDFSQLDLAVSRVFFFTTMTSNNFASFTRSITRRSSAS